LRTVNGGLKRAVTAAERAMFPALDRVIAWELLLNFIIKAAKLSVDEETAATGSTAVPVNVTTAEVLAAKLASPA